VARKEARQLGGGRIALREGDWLEVMAGLPEASVDTIITDPPYGLKFMGKQWDHGVPGEPFWEAALRVARPGAMLLAFGGTRTFHRLACAIEDAGWEIRDCLMWLHGQGFPKSLDVSKAMDKAAGAERESLGIKPFAHPDSDRWSGQKPPSSKVGVGLPHSFQESERKPASEVYNITAPATPLAEQWNGWGTALKPAWEPIVLAMKPLDGAFAQNAERHGVAGLNVDAARIAGQPHTGHAWAGQGGRKPASGVPLVPCVMSPAHALGRWPANVVLDEDAARLVAEQSGERRAGSGLLGTDPSRRGCFGSWGRTPFRSFADTGGASRFFYTAKARPGEREAGLIGKLPCIRCGGLATKDHDDGRGGRARCVRNGHPTVKPLALMEWLCKLTSTPTGGTVLDPFMGSGTTGVACAKLGRPFIGIEQVEASLRIAEARIAHAMTETHGPLFAGERRNGKTAL